MYLCNILSTCFRKRTRTCIKNPRHSSLNSNVFNVKFQDLFLDSERSEVSTFKKSFKKYFKYICPSFRISFVFFHTFCIIKMASYIGIFLKSSKDHYCRLNILSIITFLLQVCISLQGLLPVSIFKGIST